MNNLSELIAQLKYSIRWKSPDGLEETIKYKSKLTELFYEYYNALYVHKAVEFKVELLTTPEDAVDITARFFEELESLKFMTVPEIIEKFNLDYTQQSVSSWALNNLVPGADYKTFSSKRGIRLYTPQGVEKILVKFK